MAATIESLIGPPPKPTSSRLPEYLDLWRNVRNARSPLMRPAVIYLSWSDGDDARSFSQATSAATPWKTCAKAMSVIVNPASFGLDPAGLGLTILLKRGDVWEEAYATYAGANNGACLLGLYRPKISIGAYGPAGARPMLNNYRTKYNAGTAAWTWSGSGDRWTIARADIGWIRRQDDRRPLMPVLRARSTAEVEANPLSWYWASSVLHLNAGVGVDPNTISWEVCNRDTASGAAIITPNSGSADFCRIEEIDGTGFGMGSNLAANQCGVASQLKRTDEGVIDNCRSDGGSHAMVHIYSGPGDGSSWGGYALFNRCLGGYCRYDGTSGPTIFNSFSQDGGFETLFHSCVTEPVSKMPALDWWPSNNAYRGSAFYGHTGGSTYDHLMVGIKDCVLTDHTNADATRVLGAGGIGTMGDPPGTIRNTSTYRTWIFRNTQDFDRTTGSFVSLNYGGCIAFARNYVNGRMPYAGSSVAHLNGTARGLWLACVFLLDFDVTPDNSIYANMLWNSSTPASNDLDIWNCGLYVYNTTWSDSDGFRFCYDQNSTTARMYNSVYAKITGTRTAALGLVNTAGDFASRVKNNAYFGVTTATTTLGYSNDPGKVALVSAPTPLATPTTANQLLNAGAALPDGEVLEYDFYGRRPVGLSIGPVAVHGGIFLRSGGDSIPLNRGIFLRSPARDAAA